MSEQPQTIFIGWRRKRGEKHDPWQKVAGSERDKPRDVFLFLMDAELKTPDDGEWEYAVMPEGQTPSGDNVAQRYRTREMRPEGKAP